MRVIGPAVLGWLRLYGGVGWLYAAVVAALRPQDLAGPTRVFSLPVRTDTFGIACFVGSAVAALLLALVGSRPDVRSDVRSDRGVRLLRTAAAYAGAVWIYLAANSISHPATLGQQLTHLTDRPTEGQAALAAFGTSSVCYLVATGRALALGGRRAP
jgi:hypothetical protein